MLKVIIVAVDNMGLSPLVMQTLADLKISATGKIIFAHVILLANSRAEIDADRPHNDEITSVAAVEKHLEQYKSQLNCSYESEIVTGDPAIELVRLAHIHKADLLVIGNRGLTGVKRIIEDSVSSQVMTEAPCSVLVVKPAHG